MVRIPTAIPALVFCAMQMAAQPVAQKPPDGPIALSKVPKAVIIEFRRTYPKAVIQGCTKETERGWSRYEIASHDGDVQRDILYDPDGTPIVVEETISPSALPEPVRQAIRNEFPKGKITRQERVINDDGITFEVVVKTGKETQEIVYTANGKRLRREKK